MIALEQQASVTLGENLHCSMPWVLNSLYNSPIVDYQLQASLKEEWGHALHTRRVFNSDHICTRGTMKG
jgi:hypothetical protein